MSPPVLYALRYFSNQKVFCTIFSRTQFPFPSFDQFAGLLHGAITPSAASVALVNYLPSQLFKFTNLIAIVTDMEQHQHQNLGRHES